VNSPSSSQTYSLSKTSARPFWRRRLASLPLIFAFLCLSASLHADDRKVQKRVQPVYPELAKRMHIGGTVQIMATVSADGSVTDAKATTGNKMLTTAAEEAVKKWKFVAGDSQSTVNIAINFDLAE
jgi:TonB family protein